MEFTLILYYAVTVVSPVVGISVCVFIVAVGLSIFVIKIKRKKAIPEGIIIIIMHDEYNNYMLSISYFSHAWHNIMCVYTCT